MLLSSIYMPSLAATEKISNRTWNYLWDCLGETIGFAMQIAKLEMGKSSGPLRFKSFVATEIGTIKYGRFLLRLSSLYVTTIF